MSKNHLKLILSVLFISAFFVGAVSAHADTIPSPIQLPNITLDVNNPLPLVNYVDVNYGTQSPIPLLIFDLISPSYSSLSEVVIAPSISGTSPSGYHLFRGSTEVQYAQGTSTITFKNLNVANTGTGNVYSIKADFPFNILNGSKATVGIRSVTVKYTDGSSGSIVSTNGSSIISGNTQYFYTATPQLSFINGTASANNNSSGVTTNVNASFNFTVTPYPGQAYQPTANDFTIVGVAPITSFGGITINQVTVSNKGITITPQPSNNTLSAGQAYNVNLTGTISKLLPATYIFRIIAASSTIQDASGHNVNINQTFGLDNFKTNPVTVSGSSSSSGVLTVTQGPPGGNSNIQQNIDVPVYGLNLAASNGDVWVDILNLGIRDQLSNGSFENPGNFITNVKVWDGSNVLYNRNVGTGDFTLSSSNGYGLLLKGLGFPVPNGVKKNLVISFSTKVATSSRILTISGFGNTSLGYYSGNFTGPLIYLDISGLLIQQTFTPVVAPPLIIGLDASNPASQINYVDINNGAQNVPMLVFNVNVAPVTSLNQIVANVTVTGPTTVSSTSILPVSPTGLHLFQGNTELQYQPVPTNGGNLTFSNLNLNTNGGRIFSIKADFPAGTPNGEGAQVTLVSANGNQLNLLGNSQFFYHATPQLAFQNASAIVITDVTGNIKNVLGTFNFSTTPYPGAAGKYKSDGSDFIVQAKGTDGSFLTPISGSRLIINPAQSSGLLAGGQTYNLTLNVGFVGTPGVYTLYLVGASSTVQDARGNWVNISQGPDLANFKTNPVTVTANTPSKLPPICPTGSSGCSPTPPILTPAQTTTTQSSTTTTTTSTTQSQPAGKTSQPKPTTSTTVTTQQANVLAALRSLLQQAGTTDNLPNLMSAINYALGNLQKVFGL